MKFIVVTIVRNPDLTEPPMLYPPVYDVSEVDRMREGPMIRDAGLRRGESTEEMLLHIDDAVADAYALDKNVRILDLESDVDAWISNAMDLRGTPTERVTDVNRLIAILAKQAVGTAFTVEDLDAVDPTKSTRGINLTPRTARELYDLAA